LVFEREEPELSLTSAQMLLGRAAELVIRLRRSAGDDDRALADRLDNSVVRPLGKAASVGGGPAPEGPTAPADLAELAELAELAATVPGAGTPHDPPEQGGELWALALEATRMLVAASDVPEVGEAAAALQDLAIARVDESSGKERLAELVRLQAGLAERIQLAPDGPYLVTNARSLCDWLGQAVATRPQMALCRCGRAQTKPYCDGTHASTGFTGAKDPKQVPDQRVTYVGQQVTIYDNRGTCQHAGFCTDRLAAVFRTHEEPFVAPSGGRMDEIIRAVRDCPSGALSYAIDGVEEREVVDFHATRPPRIEITKDGPYRVTGGIPLVDDEGAEVPRNEGASLEHFALCRCGQSQNKPFCSGMHYYVDFKDPQPGHEPSIFEWVGGLPALVRMTRLFYEKHVPEDPLLAPLFAGMSADHPERVAKWLAEVFCGPKLYSAEHGGYPRMLSQHLGKQITEEQRSRWVALLGTSAREAGLPNDAEFRAAFDAYIEWGSRLAVENSQVGAEPPPRMPMPHWDWNTAAGPPWSRNSAVQPQEHREETPVVIPGTGQPIHFEDHIKPLFREKDQRSMSFALDLFSYADVQTHAEAIAARLRDGTMPCDGAWSAEKLDLFQRWVDAGTPE
jgi:CDGSH-type Zn-finger protein/truncated hemoglobin YjbI